MRGRLWLAGGGALLVFGLAGCGGGLSAQSTCADYLKADTASAQQDIAQLASDRGDQKALEPMWELNLQYTCSQASGQQLGDVLDRMAGKGQ